jgi:ornithine cyclodeaminase
LTAASVFSPTVEHRTAFAGKMSHAMAIPVSPVDSPEEALANADIIIAATNSSTPVFHANSLTDGMHITSIANGDKTRTRQELADTVLRRADPIFITSKETVCVNESDIFRAVRDKVIGWDKVHEIANLLLYQVDGRTDDRQVTLFKLQGTGVMDVAIGMLAFQRLKDSGLAQRL